MTKRYNQVISEIYIAPEKKLGIDDYQQATWAELVEQQQHNEKGKIRNVGLVLETRPDALASPGLYQSSNWCAEFTR